VCCHEESDSRVIASRRYKSAFARGLFKAQRKKCDTNEFTRRADRRCSFCASRNAFSGSEGQEYEPAKPKGPAANSSETCGQETAESCHTANCCCGESSSGDRACAAANDGPADSAAAGD
jgi:hypothetical protein